MLENSFGLSFFLKTPRNASNVRNIYLRITVDGIPRETSTKKEVGCQPVGSEFERAVGNKEGCKGIELFLDSLLMKVNECKTELFTAANRSPLKRLWIISWGGLRPV
ncbi:hypothetical protein LRS05_00005 [Flavobacterium sp. J372]|uniref:hypothetical protein n=1 Tax=Flavobacterium sp. J372 TaxID=2898436 RepID=UPI0021509F84|nr:hypothetical protein [Flavobacterium sp. J372]MCR5860644.1 hypothetical protein [Flavobacterium sp. J372]